MIGASLRLGDRLDVPGSSFWGRCAPGRPPGRGDRRPSATPDSDVATWSAHNGAVRRMATLGLPPKTVVRRKVGFDSEAYLQWTFGDNGATSAANLENRNRRA